MHTNIGRCRNGPRFARSLALVTLAACGGPGTGPVDPAPGPKPAVSVAVTPGGVQLLAGDTVRLTATVRAADSTILIGRTVTWSTNRMDVAEVTSNGLVTATGTGQAIIRATVGAVHAEAGIGVTALNPAPTILGVSPDSVDTGTGGALVTITGTGFAADAQILWDGAPRPAVFVSPTELRLILSPVDLMVPSPRSIAVRNPAPGGGTSATMPFTVSAGVVTVEVTPSQLLLSVGQTYTLAPRALDANGAPMQGRAFTFSSSSNGAVSVSDAGVITVHHVGLAYITVTSGNRWAQVRVDAVQPVAFVLVGPTPAGVLVGSTRPLAARTLTVNGIEVTGRTVTWSSEDPTVANVNAQGIVSGMRTGTTRVRAASEGIVGYASVEVRQWSNISTLSLRQIVESVIWPTIGTTTYVDSHGVSYPASLLVTGGTLTLRFDTNQWERSFVITTLAAGLGAVAHEAWTDQGSFTYNLSGGVRLTSQINGAIFDVLDAGYGELTIRQVLGDLSAMTYLWVLQ